MEMPFEAISPPFKEPYGKYRFELSALVGGVGLHSLLEQFEGLIRLAFFIHDAGHAIVGSRTFLIDFGGLDITLFGLLVIPGLFK